MTCAEFEDLILEDLDGQLREERKALTATHLAACQSCRAFLAAQVEVDRSLAALARLEMPAHFTDSVLRRLDAEEARRDFSGALDLLGAVGAAGAGALCVQLLLPEAGSSLPWVVAAAVLGWGAWLAFDEPKARGSPS
jgi:anti-sigma factor RsiW